MPTPPTCPWHRLAHGAAAAALLVLAIVAVTQADPPPARAATDDFDQPVFSADARGDILTVGNAQLTCDPTATFPNGASMAAACEAARGGGQPTTPSGAPYGVSNNDYVMVDVDVDDDPTTFNSTTADLQLPDGAVVLWAGLHWFGTQEVTTSNTPPVLPPQPDLWGRVRLSPPGGPYRTLDAAAATDPDVGATWSHDATTDVFGGFFDVTDLVAGAGGGTYRVADIQTYTGGGGGGYAAGWSLTVAYADADEPMRNLTVWHGLEPVHPSFGPLDLALSGFTPPPAGTVSARLGIVAFEGDRDRTPTTGNTCWSDSVVLASDTRPAGDRLSTPGRPWSTPIVDPASGRCPIPADRRDFFNSTVSDDIDDHPPIRSQPQHATNMATDIALTETTTALTNESREARVTVTSHCGCEQVNVQVVHLAIELYPPEVSVEKEVAPVEPGPVAPGDEVEWTLIATNETDFDLHRARLVDALPPGVTYVPESLEYVEGGPDDLLGPKTDAPGDDQAEYDPATRTIRARVGAGADATDGGVMTARARSTDGSQRLVVTFRTTIDAAAAGTVVTNEVVAEGEAQQLDDPFPPIRSEDRDDAEIAVVMPPPDLVVTKSTDGQVLYAGAEVTYGLSVENRGDGPEAAAVLVDVLRTGLDFVSATGGGSFDPSARTVTWDLGEMAPGDRVEVELTVRVATPVAPDLIDESGVVPNTARVVGEGDCTEAVDDDPDCEATVDNPVGDPHLLQDKVVDAAEARPGDVLTYEVRVANDGDAPAAGVVATDVLPPEVVLVDATPSVGEVATEGRTLTWTIGDLAAGAEATLRIRASVADGVWDATFENRVTTDHTTSCIAECPTTTVSHPCDDDATASCAPTRTPTSTRTRTPTASDDPSPPRTEPPARPVAASPTTATGPLSRTGAPLAIGVVVALIVGATGTCLLAASRRPSRR